MTTLRPAVPTDAEALSSFAARVFHATFDHTASADDIGGYVVGTYSPAKQAEEIAHPTASVIIAEENGLIVGFATSVKEEHGVELKRIYVDTTLQGTGLAKRLLDAVIDKAQGKSLWLVVWERNTRAIAFYRKHGFEVTSETILPGSDRPRGLIMRTRQENHP